MPALTNAMKHNEAARHSTNEAETTETNIEDKQGIDGNANPILDHARSTQDANPSSHGPRDEYSVDWYPHDDR